MRYGFYLPTRGPTAQPAAVTTMVQRAEMLGFHSVMVADHVVIPAAIESAYPYTVGGNFLSEEEALEQFTLMTFVAAKTQRLRLVSSILIVPQRNPVLTAKTIATLDWLSGGRVTVGVGVGWMREEFEALDAAPFNRRGAVTNEYLEIFKQLWTEDVSSHAGKFYSFDGLRFAPKPLQNPHPPIWVGGHSDAALRRVAQHADGWHPVGATAASPLPPEEVARKREFILEHAAQHGRSFDSLDIAYKAPIYDGGRAPAGETRRLFSGSTDAIVEDINAFISSGVTELVFDFRSPSVAESIERMQWFAETIMPKT
jgi:probable F420-dependent oxidoreductase